MTGIYVAIIRVHFKINFSVFDVIFAWNTDFFFRDDDHKDLSGIDLNECWWNENIFSYRLITEFQFLESRARLGWNSTFYLGPLGLKSRPIFQLIWVRSFVFSPLSLWVGLNAAVVTLIITQLLTSAFSSVHYLLTSFPFDIKFSATDSVIILWHDPWKSE